MKREIKHKRRHQTNGNGTIVEQTDIDRAEKRQAKKNHALNIPLGR